MILYSTNLSPFGQRVKIALRAKRLSDRIDYIDTPPGAPALAMLTPMAQIPILETERLRLPESQAIVDYLEDLYPDPPLLPDEAEDTAKCRLIARIADLYIAPAFLELMVAMRKPLPNELLAAAWSRMNTGLRYVEPYLAGDLAAGPRLTQADCALAPFLFYVPRLAAWHNEGAFPNTPKCQAYLARAGQDPAVAAAFAEMESAYKDRVEKLRQT